MSRLPLWTFINQISIAWSRPHTKPISVGWPLPTCMTFHWTPQSAHWVCSGWFVFEPTKFTDELFPPGKVVRTSWPFAPFNFSHVQFTFRLLKDLQVSIGESGPVNLIEDTFVRYRLVLFSKCCFIVLEFTTIAKEFFMLVLPFRFRVKIGTWWRQRQFWTLRPSSRPSCWWWQPSWRFHSHEPACSSPTNNWAFQPAFRTLLTFLWAACCFLPTEYSPQLFCWILV